MTSTNRYTTSFFSQALLYAGLIFLCLVIILPASAQNTKGDRPARENRFKLPGKKSQKQKRKGGSSRRIKAKGKSYANSGSAGIFSKKGRSISARHKNVFSQRSPFVRGYSKQPKNRNDRSGRPIRPIVQSKPQTRQKAWRGNISGHRIRAKSEPASRAKNIYPQRGPMVHNPSSRRHHVDRPVSNKKDLAFARQHQGKPEAGPGKRRLIPRSISGAFIARKPNNAWKRFPQQKRKGEVAFTKDIAGRKLRKKNFESKRPEIIPSLAYGRKRVGDKPYRGTRFGGGQGSATRTGRAWRGDISGGQIRGRNFSSKGKRTERVGQANLPLIGPQPRHGDGRFGRRLKRSPGTASQPGEKRTGKAPLPPRVPGIGASGVGYSGRIKSRRPDKGGGSVSGRFWNNRGRALAPRVPGIGANRVGTFQGNIKSRRPDKGGGSVSGKVWNNRQSAIPVRPPSQQGMKAGGYPGRLKKFSIQPGFSDQGEEYGGHLKGARKRPKLAGSASGKLWNNQRKPIEGKGVGAGDLRVGSFQGNMKARRPEKGGGSVSGKLWNNKQTPIPVRTPPAGAEKVAKYPGKIKRFTVQPGFSDQGEEFTGYIKRPWYRRSYSRNPNAHDKSIKQESPHQTTYQVGNLHVAVKTRKYVRNKKLVDEATKKLSPTKTTYDVEGLQVKVKQRPTGKKPHAVDGSLPGLKPSKETVKASQYARGVKRDWDYIRNPSSSKNALRVREPGKAFARATDYQGNIKMRKSGLFEKSDLHPDAKFVKINKNNVAEERGFFTNIKLWWAKTFKKNDNQPDHLKEKGRKPRYDKGEQGLWND